MSDAVDIDAKVQRRRGSRIASPMASDDKRREQIVRVMEDWAIWMDKTGDRRNTKVAVCRAPENVHEHDIQRQYDEINMPSVICCNAAMGDLYERNEPAWWAAQLVLGLAEHRAIDEAVMLAYDVAVAFIDRGFALRKTEPVSS